MRLLPWDAGFVAPRGGGGAEESDPEPAEQRLSLVDMRDKRAPNEAFVRRGASWRRMLVSQPPPVVVGRVGNSADMERGEAGGRPGFLVDVGSEGGGLRMGELYDAVYAGNWNVWGAHGGGGDGDDENFGLWVAWRVPREMASRPAEPPEVPDGWSWSSVAWLAAADLVIGEHDWDSEDACPTCYYASECFLFQNKKAQRIRYRCEEYKPTNRLFLPRPPRVPVGSRFWR
jgi:hypothetical protein